MNEHEKRLGQIFGASAYFIYQAIKHSPKISIRDLTYETGLSDKCIVTCVNRLFECNVLTKERMFLRHTRGNVYETNEKKETWKLN